MPKSTEIMKPKDLINRFCSGHVNWSLQTINAKKLLEKFTYNEIEYAYNYWKNNNLTMTSLGFLTYDDFRNMKEPVSLYRAELNMSRSEGTSSERNKQRIRENTETYGGEDIDFSLFEE